ncbi:MAG TPA: GDSL-type esterase/lipase family protein [Bryobacteraceae bacterium]|jgi:lysophospholipase L1-like esterase|nr:GDSL-type esterase/lipase family protein [Bryobacteraceae bacterium]
MTWQIPLFLAAVLGAQSPSPQTNALLGQKESGELATRMAQLVESTAFAVPGLIDASGPLKQNANATVAALQRTPLNPALTYQLINQVKAYLALADSMPRQYPFPATAEQQFAELREDLQKLQLHFDAILRRQNEQALAFNSDPDELKRYAEADAKMVPSAKGQRIVFMGDSITDAWRLNEYFPARELVNRGISGQNTSQMLGRFHQDVLALAPRGVVILAGTNDLPGNIAINQIEENLTMMGDLAKAYGIRVAMASLLPVSDYHKDTDPANERTLTRPPATIEALNRWIEGHCKSEGFVYLNYYGAMVDSAGRMQTDLSDDGLHPNAKGYRVMSPLAEDAVKKLLAPDPAQEQSRRRFHILGK